MFDEVDQGKKKMKKKSWKSTMMGEEWNKLDHGWRMEDGGWRRETICAMLLAWRKPLQLLNIRLLSSQRL